jgi:hypothetical protein
MKPPPHVIDRCGTGQSAVGPKIKMIGGAWYNFSNLVGKLVPSSEGHTEAVALLGYLASRLVAHVCSSAGVMVFFAFLSKWSNCQITRQEGRNITAKRMMAATTNHTLSFIRA